MWEFKLRRVPGGDMKLLFSMAFFGLAVQASRVWRGLAPSSEKVPTKRLRDAR